MILVLASVAIGRQSRWWFEQGVYPSDFMIYLNAGRGVFTKGWIYKDYLSFLFQPLSWVHPFASYLILCGVQVTAFLFITEKLLSVKYGFIFVWLSLPSFYDLLQVGNIQIILVALSFFPITALMCVLIKPYFIIYFLAFRAKAYLQDNGWKFRFIKGNKIKHDFTSSPLLHNEEKIG